ncbi:uncharacterized protein LOC144424639 isoform X2 [Styela clava]
MIWSLIAILILGAVARGNGQCHGEAMSITSENGEIDSPDYDNEYGKSANCSWKFTPAEGYALVLTITYQRLYILDITSNNNPKKYCLGSYNLTINNDTQECRRYIDTRYSTTMPFQYFDTMCGEDKENKSSVHVQYISDGRTYNETTTDHVLTSILEGSSYIEQTGTTFEDNRTLSTKDTENNDVGTFSETDGANSHGISDTAKLFLVSIPGFIGIILLAVTAIVFCRKRMDKYQENKNVEQDNVGGNKMENAESPIKESDQDTAAAENDEPANSTIQDEEGPYTIMYSALSRQDEEDVKENSEIKEDGHKYDMYSAVVRKIERGDKETIHV